MSIIWSRDDHWITIFIYRGSLTCTPGIDYYPIPPFLKYDWLKNCIISHNHLLYSCVTFVLENFSRFEKLYRILVFRTLQQYSKCTGHKEILMPRITWLLGLSACRQIEKINKHVTIYCET